MGQYVLPLLLYWLVLFAACYVVVEYGQKYLYDEVTGKAWLKVLFGSLLLAILLIWTKSSFDTMFTDRIGYTVIQAVVWFGVFLFVYRFQPWHAAGLGIGTMMVIAAMATMMVQSLRGENIPVRARTPFNATKPLREPVGGGTALDKSILEKKGELPKPDEQPPQ